MTEPYNPLDKVNLGLSITTAMLEKEPQPFDELPKVLGAGVYAIYYRGDYAPYTLLSQANATRFEMPVYVGKAVPEGARKGVDLYGEDRTETLYRRLREHQASVKNAENLDIRHFWCRWLVVESIWIPLGESVMIARHRPLWNALVDGFGNHAPGSGRINGVRSRWDTLHPGRAWAPKFPARAETAAEIAGDVAEYFRQRLQV